MCPAIHISSRSWLRSSSTHEPSDPPLAVLSLNGFKGRHAAGNDSAGAGHDDVHFTVRL